MARARGFTLVEVLVALFALALLAGMSWRGLDGMMRAREATEARADEILTLQTGLAQWAADLEAIETYGATPALEWNGRVLRLTRRGTLGPAEGPRVAAWTRRDGHWLRWQSPPVTTRGELDNAWLQADLWAQNQNQAMRQQEVDIGPLEDWQIFFFRGNAWTNPQSSAASGQVTPPQGTPPQGTPPPATSSGSRGNLPDGVRLVLLLPPGRAISGRLQRDWVRPALQ